MHQAKIRDVREELAWLISNKILWNTETAVAITRKKYLKLLKLMVDGGCVMDERLCEAIAILGDVKLFAWASACGCPWDRDECADIACKNNDIKMLKLLVSMGYRPTERVFARACERDGSDVRTYLMDFRGSLVPSE